MYHGASVVETLALAMVGPAGGGISSVGKFAEFHMSQVQVVWVVRSLDVFA